MRQGNNKKTKGYKKTRFILKCKKSAKTFAIAPGSLNCKNTWEKIYKNKHMNKYLQFYNISIQIMCIFKKWQ